VSYASSYAVRNGDEQVLRVDELIRMRQGERAVRLTYSVSNPSNRAVAFRASILGVSGGTASPTATPGRGLTIVDDRDGSGARLEEVRTSRLPRAISLRFRCRRGPLQGRHRVAGEQTWIGVYVRDALSEPRPDAVVRWSVFGVTDIAERTARTDTYGETTLRYAGARSGTDTVRVYVDLDRDGVQDEASLATP
jgi:hypothetical protein